MNTDDLIRKNFKKIRKEKGLTQKQVGDSLGVTESLINQWESGRVNISFEKIIKLSDAYGIDVDQFNILKDEQGNEYYKVPILGDIACGLPIFAQDNIEDYMALPIKYRDKDNEQHFFLRAKGNSMTGVGINDGNLLHMRTTSDLKKGQIGGFLFKDSGEVNLKIYHPMPKQNKVILKSANKSYPDLIFENEEIENIKIFACLKEIQEENYTIEDVLNIL